VQVGAAATQPEHWSHGQQKAQTDQQKALAKAHGNGFNFTFRTLFHSTKTILEEPSIEKGDER
jgi:hypothetical protein